MASSTFGLVGGLVVAIGSPAAQAGATGVPASGAAVLVSGTVRSDGRPVAGAQVVLYEWPDSAVLSRLRPGQAVPWRLVASSTTGASGGYELSVAASALLPLAAPDGVANLELFAASAGARASFSFPLDPVDGEPKATVANLQLRSAPRSAGTSTPRSGGGGGCYTVYEKDLGKHWDVVGQTYSVTTDVDHTFVYESGASSTLGVGISATGQTGPGQGNWSEGGTAVQSSTAQVTYPTYGNGQGVYYESEFVYGLYFTGGLLCDQWSAEPTGYAGGANTSVSNQAPGTVKADCTPYIPDTAFTKTTTLAVEWTDGLDIAAVLGIDLSTQTGYSSTASVQFIFHAERDLCGTNGPPGGNSPSQMVARSYMPGT